MKGITNTLLALLLLAAVAACTPSQPTEEIVGRRPAAADQTTSDTTGAVVNAAPPAAAVIRPSSELFHVRPQGAKGPLLAYDMADGQLRFTLPDGMLSADGSGFYAAVREADGTTLNIYDPQSGRLVFHVPVEGAWRVSGVSPNGTWVALAREVTLVEKVLVQSTGEWRSEVQILDMKMAWFASDAGRGNGPAVAEGEFVVHKLHLPGRYEVETISTSGDALFLQEFLPPENPTQYLVRLYDLRGDEMQADPLRDAKRLREDQVMTGYAWNGIGSPDGRWLLTLYLNTEGNAAFIHTLDLIEKFALCIALPSGNGDIELLKYYTLTLAPDGRTFYAANAALGVVAQVSPTSYEVIWTKKFEGQRPAATESQEQSGYSVLSADGKHLYFSDGATIWGYDVRGREVVGPYEVDGPVVGLGLSHDGGRLVAAGADGTVTAFDTATGDRLPLPDLSVTGS